MSYKTRNNNFELCGLSQIHAYNDVMGKYSPTSKTSNGRIVFKQINSNSNWFIWQSKDGVWCIGKEKHIGTTMCYIHTVNVVNSSTPIGYDGEWCILLESEWSKTCDIKCLAMKR